MPRALAALTVIASLGIVIPSASANDLSEEHEQARRRQESLDAFRQSPRKLEVVCGRLGRISLQGLADAPIYYFAIDTGRLISACGGACWMPQGKQKDVCMTMCPPPEWKANQCG